MTVDLPTYTLSNGKVMPQVGLGTWKSPVGKTGTAVKAAVKAGYRMIDCANDYGNEEEIGEALAELFAEGVVKREELFIQCKLWNTNHRPEHVRPDLEASLKELRLDYVDNFVIHWPQACPSAGTLSVCANGPRHAPIEEKTMFPVDATTGLYSSDNASHFVETWHAMEDLVDAGLTRSIGLSNFNRRQITEVLDNVRKYKPVLLQNEGHPYLQNKDLIDFCRQNGIQFQAYSPLGSADRPWAQSAGLPPSGYELLKDPRIIKIGEKYGKTPAQVVLRWHLTRGVSVCPKSVTPSRVEENYNIFDFALTDEDIAVFDTLNIGWRHLLWAETSMHPDYPFKDDLPHNYVIEKAPLKTSSGN